MQRGKNVAIAKHCNLRPVDAEPVIFRFNWDARAKFEVGQRYLLLSYNVSTADTLLYSVTLTFDIEHF